MNEYERGREDALQDALAAVERAHERVETCERGYGNECMCDECAMTILAVVEIESLRATPAAEATEVECKVIPVHPFNGGTVIWCVTHHTEHATPPEATEHPRVVANTESVRAIFGDVDSFRPFPSATPPEAALTSAAESKDRPNNPLACTLCGAGFAVAPHERATRRDGDTLVTLHHDQSIPDDCAVRWDNGERPTATPPEAGAELTVGDRVDIAYPNALVRTVERDKDDGTPVYQVQAGGNYLWVEGDVLIRTTAPSPLAGPDEGEHE